MSVYNDKRSAESYTKPQLFLGDEMGLLDTIHHHYPELWQLYKQMKSLDWDENEFDYAKCLVEFETCDPVVAEMMKKTLTWQWEADSVASRTPATLIAPFCSSTELFAAELRINDNETLHAATYSEIVRLSFTDPKLVLSEMLAVKETVGRMNSVVSFLNEFQKQSHEYALYGLNGEPKQWWFGQIIKFYFIMYLLERVQFMASFAITFTICESDIFQPIGTAVQKIAQDELEIHCEFRKAVLTRIRETEEGQAAFEYVYNDLENFYKEVIQSEFEWIDYLFSGGKSLTGTNPEKLKQWVLFNAQHIDNFAGFSYNGTKLYDYPVKNPMPHLDDWFNLSSFQPAPQEQAINQYKAVSVRNDAEMLDIL